MFDLPSSPNTTHPLINYNGNLERMPAFLGPGDPDAHVPWQRAEQSASVFSAMGAEVTLRRYPGMPLTIRRQEIAEARKLLARILRPAAIDSNR
jgi:phospholipase/carboxylesterase